MNIFGSLLSQPATETPKPAKQHRGIEIKSTREIEIMRQSARIVATVLKEISQMVQPGMTTWDVDIYAEKRIREMGAVPSFKGYHGFPASICSSINNEVVHGIPNRKKVIRAGDVVKVDTGAYFQGFHGDSCITIAVVEVSPEAAKLIRVAEEALFKGIAQVKAGNYLLDIAGAIQDHVEANGFSVVEEFTGHGVGRNLHEEPSVFNYTKTISFYMILNRARDI
jgi:methionyl aminopeptidase